MRISINRGALFRALLGASCALQMAGSAPAPAQQPLVMPAEHATAIPNCRFNSQQCRAPGRYHAGTDYDDNGTGRILAVADGPIAKVVRSGDGDRGLGNTVIQRIDTAQGLKYVLYGHLGRFTRTEGCLRAGEHLGDMGSTGTDNVHLHLEFKNHPGLGDTTDQHVGYTPAPAENQGYEDPEQWLTTGRSTGACSAPAGGVTMHETRWWARLSGLTSGAGEVSAMFGAPGDQPRMCRFDGGAHAMTAFRPGNGTWHVRSSFTSGPGQSSFAFGGPGDRALCGDLLGVGRDFPVVFRAATGQWFARLTPTSGAGDISIAFGQPGDQAMLCDLDGLGMQVPVVFRNGKWLARKSWSSGAAEVSWTFGGPGDVAVCADVFGTGKDTPVVFHPPNATFYARAGFTSGPDQHSWAVGYPSDVPMVAEVNGDGRLDTVVAR